MVVLSAIRRTLRFHLGSIALGSLIIVIVKVIRTVVAYVSRSFQ
jgi:hypothetical protein